MLRTLLILAVAALVALPAAAFYPFALHPSAPIAGPAIWLTAVAMFAGFPLWMLYRKHYG